MSTETIELTAEQSEKAAPPLTPTPIPILDPKQKVIIEDTSREGIRVDMLDDFVRVYLLNGTTKDLGYMDFVISLLDFHGKLKSEDESSDSPLQLPENVYAIENTATRLKIGQYFPGGIREVQYNSSKVPRLVPNIIISIVLLKQAEKGSFEVESIKYLCTSLAFQELPRKIYAGPNLAGKISILPFSNMYDRGDMCFGANQTVRNFTKNDLRGLKRYHDVLWDSPFNDDLGVRALRTSTYGTTAKWFAYLAKCAKDGLPFPYSDIGI